MTEQQTSATEATEASTETTQAEKTYTQREVDDMLAKTKGAITKKIASKYEDLGDPDELRNIVSQYQKTQQDQQLKRGEFEKVLQEKMSAKDIEIQKRDKLIEEFRLNTPILDAAARLRSVNPEQVKALVRGNVRLNQDGEPEVVDKEGKVRYDDSGRPISVDSYVQEFLAQNPHFVSATPSTTNARSSVSNKTQKIDITKLNMNDPDQRAIYKEYRKTLGL
jgi:hypothetical protein